MFKRNKRRVALFVNELDRGNTYELLEMERRGLWSRFRLVAIDAAPVRPWMCTFWMRLWIHGEHSDLQWMEAETEVSENILQQIG
jgi:hypothetical protein